jgi:hypothetical protein
MTPSGTIASKMGFQSPPSYLPPLGEGDTGLRRNDHKA